ncbi:MAG: CPBP family intramembrane metalloprotease [Prevotellaceae bacterium]|nr:CPBP family intramembrane metalloprotease [Prevotellaceae bacterium]
MRKILLLLLVYVVIQLICSFGLPHQLPLASLLSALLMMAYLGTFGYLSGDKRTFSPVSASFIGLSLLFGISAIFLVDGLMSVLPLPPLPPVMEEAFVLLQTDPWGILYLTLMGPITEELLFRGAITRLLLDRYKQPAIAILLSGVIFGIVHGNFSQGIPAFLLGAAFAWLYSLTRSVVPGIAIHILNNALSVFLSRQFPNEDDLPQLMGTPAYLALLVVSLILLAVTVRKLMPYRPQ